MPANPFYSSPFWLDLRRQALKRDGYRCTVPGCGSKHRLTVDHIKSRPRGATVPTEADRLDNLRVLCASHDAQRKEAHDGKRRGGEEFVVRGCDESGWPLDPKRRG